MSARSEKRVLGRARRVIPLLVAIVAVGAAVAWVADRRSADVRAGDDETLGSPAGAAALAIGGGHVAAVWTEFGTGQVPHVFVRLRKPGGEFGPRIELPSEQPPRSRAAVAVDGNGTTTVVWAVAATAAAASGGIVVRAVQLDAAGRLRPVRDLWRGPGENVDRIVAASAGGTTTVAWDVGYLVGESSTARVEKHLVAARLTADGTAVPGRDVVVAGPGIDFAVAGDADGAAVIVFSVPSTAVRQTLRYAHAGPGSAFGEPRTLRHRAGNHEGQPDVAFVAPGTARVVFRSAAGRTTADASEIVTTTIERSVASGVTTVLGSGRFFEANPSVVAGPRGTALAAWSASEYSGPKTSSARIGAAAIDARGRVAARSESRALPAGTERAPMAGLVADGPRALLIVGSIREVALATCDFGAACADPRAIVEPGVADQIEPVGAALAGEEAILAWRQFDGDSTGWDADLRVTEFVPSR
jgi:hypothetical protein